MSKHRLALLGSVSAAALALAVQARAESFTIVAGPPVTVTQTLNTPGNIGTVEVLGLIDTDIGQGILATADGVTVTNSGTVTSAGSGIVVQSYSAITNSSSGTVTAGNGAGIEADSNNTITNEGLISGTVGIFASGDSNTIGSSGLVTGVDDDGIRVEGSNTTITNSGTVTSGRDGREGYGIRVLGDNTTITNSGTATGVVNDGIRVQGAGTMITNSGAVTGAGSGIVVQSYSVITNSSSGTVTAGNGAGIEADSNNTITNEGLISGNVGIFALGDSNTISSSGTVTGGDYGIYANGSNNIITNYITGTVASRAGVGYSGIGAFGDNNIITNFGTATGGDRNGIHAEGSNNTITNAGTATGGSNGILAQGSNTTITNSGTATGNTGIYAFGTGTGNTISNSGTVTGVGDTGIRADGDDTTITNSGTVASAGSGIVVQSYSAITNSSSGTVTAGNGAGISAKSNNTITNAGLISGNVGIGAVGNSNTISSSGMVTGVDTHGILVDGSNTTITNSGTVTSSRDRGREDGWEAHGIRVRGDDTMITNSGTVTGASSGIVARGGNQTISNSGTATGIRGDGISSQQRNRNTITNSGMAMGGREGHGVIAQGFYNAITNSGTATGGLAGIRTFSSSTITNSGTARSSSGEGYGIYVDSNNTVINSGTAEGYYGIFVGSNSTITNSGDVLGVGAGIIASGTDTTITNSGMATGIFGIEADGDNNTIINSGTATGVRMNGSFGTLRNSGTVTASAGADALSTGDAAIGTVVVNTGIIDGRVALAASFENSGWLGVTEPGAVTAHQISGTYVQTAWGMLGLQVGATASDTLQTDIARLDGTLATSFTGETFQRSYTLLTASQEITGAFATYTPVGLPGLFASSLSYGPTSVTLTLVADVTPIAGLTPNELAVGTSLTGIINAYGGPVLGGLPDALSPLYALDASQLPQALDALSGESYASEQSILLGDGLYSRLTLLGRLRQGAYAGQGDALEMLSNGGPTLTASTKGTDLSFGMQATTAWAQAFGSRTELDGETDTSDVSSNFGGLMTGADTQVESWLVGAAIGYTQSSTTVDDLSSSSDVDSLMAALYAGTGSGPWSVRLGATYASNQTDSTRTIAYPGFAEQASADYNSTTTQLFAEVAYGLVMGTAAVEPFAGLAWINVDSVGFSETGATAGLSVSSNSSSVTYGTLGVRAATSVVTSGGMVLQPRGALAWQTASGDLSPTAQMAFLSAPNAGFTVGGAPLADNAALIEIGADLLISEQAQLGLSYVGQYADGVSSYGLQAAMTWTF